MEFNNIEELIFGEASDLFFDEGTDSISDDELNEFGIIETGEEPEVAGYAIALENEQNFNNIMNAMMIKEYTCLESTGAEMVYTEGVIGDFFDAVSKTIKVWWGKFMDMIQKAQDFVIKYTKENGMFIKKYKGKSMKAPTESKMDVKGYAYAKLQSNGKTLVTEVMNFFNSISKGILAEINSDDIDVINKAKETLEQDNTEFEDNLKLLVNDLAKTKDKAVAEAVKCYYRGPKQDIVVGDFKELLKEMEQAVKIRKHLKEDYNDAKKACKELLNSVSRMKKACSRKDETETARISAAKTVSTSIKKTMNAMGKVQSASIQVYYEKCRADRAKAMWIVNHQPKKDDKKNTNESGSLLAQIN